MKKSIIMLASTTVLLLASSARAEQIAPNENTDNISQPTDNAQGSHSPDSEMTGGWAGQLPLAMLLAVPLRMAKLVTSAALFPKTILKKKQQAEVRHPDITIGSTNGTACRYD